MNDVMDELVTIEKKCAEAFNRNNLNNLLAYFSDDITGFSSTAHDRFKGKDELKKTFEYYLSEADTVSYEILEPTMSRFDDMAILSFYWRVTLKTGSKRTEIPGRGTHVYRKENGEWKIIHEHFSKAH